LSPESIGSDQLEEICPACSTSSVTDWISFNRTPRSCQKLHSTQAQALQSNNLVDLQLRLCGNCGLVWNGSWSGTDLEAHYDSDYQSTISGSRKGRRHQIEIAKALDRLVGLRGKTVLEIGCGDGFFLSELNRCGARTIGFEPSSMYGVANGRPDIEVVNDFFPFDGNSAQEEPVNVIVLRHVLEHLPKPSEALGALASMQFAGKNAEYLFIEVPNASELIARNLYFDFYFDHIYYFTSGSLTRMLLEAGWNAAKELDLPKEFLGWLCCNRLSPDHRVSFEASADDREGFVASAEQFARSYSRWKGTLNALLDRIRESGNRIAAWGAGGRGVSLLNCVGTQRFSYVVDMDSNKHGRYLPGLGVPVRPPSDLRSDPVDYVLVTSFTFFQEIVEQLSWFRDNGGRIITAYPMPAVLEEAR